VSWPNSTSKPTYISVKSYVDAVAYIRDYVGAKDGIRIPGTQTYELKDAVRNYIVAFAIIKDVQTITHSSTEMIF